LLVHVTRSLEKKFAQCRGFQSRRERVPQSGARHSSALLVGQSTNADRRVALTRALLHLVCGSRALELLGMCTSGEVQCTSSGAQAWLLLGPAITSRPSPENEITILRVTSSIRPLPAHRPRRIDETQKGRWRCAAADRSGAVRCALCKANCSVRARLPPTAGAAAAHHQEDETPRGGASIAQLGLSSCWKKGPSTGRHVLESMNLRLSRNRKLQGPPIKRLILEHAQPRNCGRQLVANRQGHADARAAHTAEQQDAAGEAQCTCRAAGTSQQLVHNLAWQIRLAYQQCIALRHGQL
jgi:hypothetical protein